MKVPQRILTLPLSTQCVNKPYIPITSTPHQSSRNLHIHAQTNPSPPGGGGAAATRRQKRLNLSSPRVHTPPATRPPNPSSFLSSLDENVSTLAEWFGNKKNVLCLTGAGLSTESGLPDYRGHAGSYHGGYKPMLHDEFMRSEMKRKKFWARNMVGWKNFSSSEPNPGHYALAALEETGTIGVSFPDAPHFDRDDGVDESLHCNGHRRLSIITQNVDTLHHQAGSKHVCELHGQTRRAKCMTCGYTTSRDDFQNWLADVNTDWLREARAASSQSTLRPDGDADIDSSYSSFCVPNCPHCRTGFFKPDVVFFGDNVPRSRVDKCFGAVAASDGLLVVGSSLAVYSSFRFVLEADKRGIPIAVLNVGETRAERMGLGVLKVESPIGATLEGVLGILSSNCVEARLG